jgi:flagellar basal body-associated protein FliL
LNAQSTQSNLFFDGFLSRTADNSSKLLIIVIIVAVTLLASVIVLIPVLLSIRFTKEEVVRLFLEVPDKFIKSLYQKCESFVSSL